MGNKQTRMFNEWWEEYCQSFHPLVLPDGSREIAFEAYKAALNPQPPHPQFEQDGFYAICGEDLLRIQAVMQELYNERTLNADDMRDLAHKLYYSLREVTGVM